MVPQHSLFFSLKTRGVNILFLLLRLRFLEINFTIKINIQHVSMFISYAYHQAAGIKYVGMRNEQAVSLSTVWVFLLPGPVCLVVSGPGLIHALGGHLMLTLTVCIASFLINQAALR
uniref:Uncharacterized protein n=1 Tax=Cyprinus carpio TaxID=7962 RepID=A0A8C2KJZ6_CYPCA